MVQNAICMTTLDDYVVNASVGRADNSRKINVACLTRPAFTSD